MQIAAIFFTLAMLTLLWWNDPKRRRAEGAPAAAQPLTLRRVYLIAALLPGAVLALRSDAAAVFVWLGSCAIGGWLVSQIRTSGSDPL